MSNAIAVASLVVGLASMVLAYQSIQVSKELANATGSLDKPSIEVGIGGHLLETGKENYILIGSPTIATTKVAAIGVIPFTFKSTGKKSIDSLSISFQYHDLFRRLLLENAGTLISGPFSDQVKKAISRRDKDIFVSYSISSLNPGISMQIEEPFFLEETQLQSSVPVTTKDGAKMSIEYDVTYSRYLGLSVSARDSQFLGYSLSVAIQRANTPAALATGQLTRQIRRKQTDLRTKLGAFQYFIALLSSSPMESAILVFSHQEKIADGNNEIYTPTGKNEVAYVRYPLLTWKMLVRN
jgi:hypothetical protein